MQAAAKALAVERADAGVTMHHQRRLAVPATHEVLRAPSSTMLTRWRDKTVDLFGDVVHLHPQMIGFDHRLRPLHLRDIGHDGEDVAGPCNFDGVGQGGERADVDHGSFRWFF